MTTAARPERLSKRHLDILPLVANGYSNAEIGAALGITAGTVGQHMKTIYLILGIDTRSRLIVYARDHGYLPTQGA